MFLMFANLTEDVHLSITCKSNNVGHFSPWSLYVSDQNTKKVKKSFKKGCFQVEYLLPRMGLRYS